MDKKPSDKTLEPKKNRSIPKRLWDKIWLRHVRLTVQIILVLALNLTIIGGLLSAFLPIIRLDLPWFPRGELRLCPLATIQRVCVGTWEMSLLILTIGMILLICVLLGRLLCAWACPFGLLMDLITYFRTLIRVNIRELSLKVHERLGAARFALLFFSLLLSLSIGVSYFAYTAAGDLFSSFIPEGTARVAPFCSVCPTPTVYYVITVFQTSNLNFSDPTHYIMWGILGIFVIGGFLIPRFWCRYFCPVGALSSCFNSVSLAEIHKDIPKCTKCNYCVSCCPMRVQKIRDEDKDSRVSDINCTFCLECVEKCPEKALTLRFAGREIYKGGREWWEKRRGS